MTDNKPATTSPLSEAEPRSLEELFSRDPLKLTRSDRDAIVRELRAQSERWAQAQSQAPSGKRSSGTRPPKITGPLPDIDLTELGLE